MFSASTIGVDAVTPAVSEVPTKRCRIGAVGDGQRRLELAALRRSGDRDDPRAEMIGGACARAAVAGGCRNQDPRVVGVEEGEF